MSCFSQFDYARYADDEMTPDEVRPIEAHLVQCEDCRELVVALRDEGKWIARVLSEREVAAAPVVAVPQRGFAIGMPLALAASALLLTLVGWGVEQIAPANTSRLGAFQWTGVIEMGFDLYFFLRDKAPGLVELGAGLAATASFAAIASIGASMLLRRIGGTVMIGLVALACLAPRPAAAVDLRVAQEVVIVGADETIDQTLVVNGESVRIEGIIEGNLVVGAERVTLRGEVRGSALIWARDLEVDGKVEGNLHAVAERGRLSGEVGGTFFGVGEQIVVTREAKVGRDVVQFTRRLEIDGEIGRDLVFGGDSVEAAGQIGRDVDVVGAERVTVLADARIGRNVRARLDDEDRLVVDPAALIQGTAEVLPQYDLESEVGFMHAHFWIWRLVRVAGAIVTGLLIHLLWPGFFRVRVDTGRDFLRALLFGLAVLIGAPIVAVLVGLTLIGIPIAVLIAFLYVAGLYLAFVLVGAMIGLMVLGREPEISSTAFAQVLALGLVIIMVFVLIPWVGELVRPLVMLVGLGLLYERLRDALSGAAA